MFQVRHKLFLIAVPSFSMMATSIDTVCRSALSKLVTLDDQGECTNVRKLDFVICKAGTFTYLHIHLGLMTEPKSDTRASHIIGWPVTLTLLPMVWLI